MKLKEKLRFFLGFPLTIIAFIFIGKIFYDNRLEIIQAIFNANVYFFLVGVLFLTCFFITKSFIWIEILRARGFTPPVRATLYKYSLSEIRRYIPGSIFAFISRIGTHEREIPKKETLKGIGIEAVLLALSSALVSIPAVIFVTGKINPNLSSFIFPSLFLLTILSFLLVFFNLKIRRIASTYTNSFLLFVIAWVFYGLGSLFIAASFVSLDQMHYITLSSLFVLSWLCGYLFFVTPMGLGVREVVVIFGLSFFTPASIAGTIAIMGRLGMVLGELSYLLITRVGTRKNYFSILSRLNPYLTFVVLLSSIYLLYFSLFTVLRHNSFFSGRFDLGNMTQTIWNTSQGRFFLLTNPDGVEVMSRLGVHSDYLLALLAPLYLIWADPRMLLIFQSVALSSGGIITYFLAKRILKSEKLAVAFSVSYLTNFWLHEQNIFDFHAVTIATPLILACFYFLLKKNYFLWGLFLFLAITTKENVILLLSPFGFYFLKERKWLAGLALTLLGVAAFLFVTSTLIPNARGEAHFALGTYSELGTSTGGILKNLISNPAIAASLIFSKSTILYFNQHLLPTGYTSLLSPLYLVFAIPEMAIYLLSNNFEYRSYQYHFGAVILPFILIASMHGARKIIRRFKDPQVPRLLAFYIISMGILSMYFYSPLPGMKNADYRPFTRNLSTIHNYIGLIPEDASVSASNNLGAHLSHRQEIFAAPLGFEQAVFIVLYNEKKEIVDQVDQVSYELIVEDKANNFYLFRRNKESHCPTCNP